MKDKVILNLADNPELAEFFSRKSPGDTCKLEVEATLDDLADDIATLSVKGVEYPGDDEEEAKEAPAPDTEKEDAPPVAIIMGVGKPKKK